MAGRDTVSVRLYLGGFYSRTFSLFLFQTAATLTFAVYMLTQHPHITKRLREEIAQFVGTGRPTYDQIKEMKYLRAFINETLRLYPPVYGFTLFLVLLNVHYSILF